MNQPPGLTNNGAYPLRFSVIIPTHFRPDLLKRSLVSLKLQKLSPSDFEVLVVTSPNDSSLPFLENYEAPFNLQVCVSDQDSTGGRNVSLKRNLGAKKATGQWLAFTDDDCVPGDDWLSSANSYTNDDSVHGIEGLTKTGSPLRKTLTWKGLQRLGRPQSYQTCNIFYRTQTFRELGGFDEINFPWYLEDTDLAWTFLAHNKKIVFEEKAVIEHPVGEPAPWRLLHEARNSGLKVILFKKHQDLFFGQKMKTLRLPHLGYLFLGFVCLLSLITLNFDFLLVSSLIYLALLSLHLVKTFWKLSFSFKELALTGYGLFLYPYVSLYSFLRYARSQRIGIGNFLKLLWS